MTTTATWKNYLQLCKPKVVALIIFTVLVGMLLATPQMPPLLLIISGIVGIGLLASASAAINHYLDQQADSQMARTQDRPLPTGSISGKSVLVFAACLTTLGMVVLLVWVNTLTAVLTFLSLLGYALIYTRYLKHLTPQNIVIGGAAGAAPPVLGWCAITGQLHPHALLLFLIIFVWTPPHFWALAVAKRAEYAKAKIPMLPVTHGVAFTNLQIVLYSILLFVVTLLPYLTRMSGLIYLAVAVILGLIFIYYAVQMVRRPDNEWAMKTFFFSINYLMVLFAALLVDHYFPLAIS